MDVYDHVFLGINAIICSVIVLRLVTFERRAFQYSHSWGFSVIAYFFILSNATLVIRILTGDLAHVDWACVVNNLFLCAGLLMMKGNIRPFLQKKFIPEENRGGLSQDGQQQ